MFHYLLVSLFQFSFNVLKVLEIKYTYQNKLKPLLLNSLLINAASLGSVFISIDSLLGGDYLIIPFYVGFAILGKWFAMTNYENIRYKIVKLLKIS
jgi:hypothetical protein